MNRYSSIAIWSRAIWGHHPKQVQIHELPRCTDHIRYAQAWPPDRSTAMGIFTFLRELVLEEAAKHVERNKGNPQASIHPFDGAVLHWLSDPDPLAQEPVRLPEGWAGMETILLPLIETGHFAVRCLGCAREYQQSDLVLVPETHRSGSFHRIWDCPMGHRLIQIEYLHLCR